MNRIIVVGGGVAGMMAAIRAADRGKKVTILEKNSELGKKILITGNGRCNFTNEDMKSDYYMSSLRFTDDRTGEITREFVDKVLSGYNNIDFLDTLSGLGMSYYVREGYYYPKTDEARTFRDALESEIKRRDIEVVYNFNLRSIEKTSDGFLLSDKKREYHSGSIVIAAGGNAAPKTGSSGDCYYYLKKLGHNILEPQPALTTLKAAYPSDLQGVNALSSISLKIDNKIIRTEKGFIKYYKGMLSGIPVYQLSVEAIAALRQNSKVELIVDFATDTNLQNAMSLKGSTVREALYKSINPKIVDVILRDNNIDGEMLLGVVDESDIKHIIELFSNVNYEIIGFGGFDSAQATLGGVDIREINPDTMESKICKGLYMAGEIIDIVGRCGGYNIQWASSTAVIAGSNA